MEKKNNGIGIFISVLVTLTAIGVALALLIRTENRLLRLLGKVEKAIPKKSAKSDPITVEL